MESIYFTLDIKNLKAATRKMMDSQQPPGFFHVCGKIQILCFCFS